MKEHLTPEELLRALKQCMNYDGSDSCDGCPNAVPGTEDEHGFCKCRFETRDEMIYILEKAIQNNYSI